MSRDPYEIRHLIPAVVAEREDLRTKDHRCGNCSWGGTGRIDCKNRKSRFQQVLDAIARARGDG